MPFTTVNHLSGRDMAEPRDFILSNTRLQHPPFLSELELYLSDEVMPLWARFDEALGGSGAPPPFWAFAWAGGQAIARYLLDHPRVVTGRTVLDVATGSGLCAIAAMAAGAASAQAVDVDPYCLEAVALNAAANRVQVDVSCRDPLDCDPPKVDIILAGDVFYEEPLAARVLPWLQAAHRRGITVLLGDPCRAHLPSDGLVRLAEYEIPTTRELEDREVKLTRVYTFGAMP
jgi:predicted nicotinamide N-methyase